MVRSAHMLAVATATVFEGKHLDQEALAVSIKARLNRIVRQWMEEELDKTEEAWAGHGAVDLEDVDNYKDIHYTQLEEAIEALQQNQQWKVKGLADELVLKHDLQVEKGSTDYGRLCRELLKAKVAHLQEELRRLDGVSTAPGSWGGGVPDAEPAPAPVHVPTGPTIGQAFKTYMGEHTYRRIQNVIAAEFRHFLDHAQLTDQDPVASIVKPLVVAWKTYQMGKVGATTMNKKIRYLSHFCSWCEAHEYMPSNPTKGLRVAARAERAGKLKRLAFSPEQMRTIIEALKVRKDTARTKYLEEFYWVCVVVLFSGMRSEESWNLWTDRVRETDGVFYFDLAEDPGRKVKLKTLSSARTVPLHSGLLALGFLGYLTKRRASGKGKPVRLFPNLKNSSVVSRFFMQTLRALKITNRAFTLHSARHAWETMLAHAGVQGEMRDRLLGHASTGSVGATVYLHLNWKMSELKEAVEKVKF